MNSEAFCYILYHQDDYAGPSTSSSRGRPRKDFNEASKRTKRRRLCELSTIENCLVNSLVGASESSLPSTEIDEVLSLIVNSTPVFVKQEIYRQYLL